MQFVLFIREAITDVQTLVVDVVCEDLTEVKVIDFLGKLPDETIVVSFLLISGQQCLHGDDGW